ncbi:hypothetical protein AB5I41_18655 [Sphingomonas sp. MMS24-JH45]
MHVLIRRLSSMLLPLALVVAPTAAAAPVSEIVIDAGTGVDAVRRPRRPPTPARVAGQDDDAVARVRGDRRGSCGSTAASR